MYRITCTLLFVWAATLTVEAQTMPDPAVPQGENLQIPEGWMFRLDAPDETVAFGADPETAPVYFVNMTPGWHLTTGPRGVFYHPMMKASGDYAIHAALHLFNPNGRNREGYGLFFGGKDLQGEQVEYLYFLLRNTGDFLIKSRSAETLTLHQDWTPSDHIIIYDDESEFSVLNDLSVEVEGDSMHFYINQQKVSTLPKTELSTDGTFGLRVNHNVNLHIEALGLGKE